jgi:hypothetical protein
MTVKLPLWLPCLLCGCAGLILGLWLQHAKVQRFQLGMAGLGLIIQMQNQTK